MNRARNRIVSAIHELDMGISHTKLSVDFIGTVNKVLREVGAAPLANIQDRGPMLRAALAIEAAAPSEEVVEAAQ